MKIVCSHDELLARLQVAARGVSQRSTVQILSGAGTRMWTYNRTFPGPTIRRPTGQHTTVTLVNNLPSTAGELSLYSHGNHSVLRV